MKRLLGGLLMGLGILIAGASGLCSAAFLVLSLSDSSGAGEMVGLVLVIGGVPFMVGIGLTFAGRHLLRQAREDAVLHAADEFQ